MNWMTQVNQKILSDALADFESMNEVVEQSSDGRHLRRERNREHVIESLLQLLSEGIVWPMVAEIFMRAGVSERSIFRYCDNTDDLTRAAAEHQVQAALP